MDRPLLWGAGCVLLGYGFAASLATVGHYLTYGPLLLLGLLLTAFVLHQLRRRRQLPRGAQSGAHLTKTTAQPPELLPADEPTEAPAAALHRPADHVVGPGGRP